MLGDFRQSLGSEEGFTLVELLVGILIVGVLSSIAYPTYHEFRRRAYDAHAQNDRLTLVQSQETYWIDNETYTNCHPTSDCHSTFADYGGLFSNYTVMRIIINTDSNWHGWVYAGDANNGECRLGLPIVYWWLFDELVEDDISYIAAC